jgi:hypothetical protein
MLLKARALKHRIRSAIPLAAETAAARGKIIHMFQLLTHSLSIFGPGP